MFCWRLRCNSCSLVRGSNWTVQSDRVTSLNWSPPCPITSLLACWSQMCRHCRVVYWCRRNQTAAVQTRSSATAEKQRVSCACLPRLASWYAMHSTPQNRRGCVIFTARCTLVQSAVLRSHVVCPSVCPSVTLVDQGNIGWISWKLIARTLSLTPSLFGAERPLTYYQGNMGKFGESVRREKAACWSTKAAISLKRVKVEEKLLWGHWGAYRNSPTLCPTVPSLTLYGLLFPKIAVRKPRPKLQSLYLRNGQSYWLQIWPVHSQGLFEQNHIKNFGEKGAWAYPGTAQNFKVLPIISGTGKATDFKFSRYIHRVHPNKSPLKFWRRGSVGWVGVSRDCPIFGYPYYLKNG